MEIETKTVRNLVTALENATQMAKHLPSTTTVKDSATIYASLRATHRHLSLFLSHTPQPQPSSADVSDSPMQLADEDQQVIHGEMEKDSKMVTIDSVEERMKDCFINNKKRLKRSLSPSSVVARERRRWLENEIVTAKARIDYDPHVTKLRALDLIYQFQC